MNADEDATVESQFARLQSVNEARKWDKWVEEETLELDANEPLIEQIRALLALFGYWLAQSMIWIWVFTVLLIVALTIIVVPIAVLTACK